MIKSKGRQNKLTGQAAEFLVCAELARRELIATPFAGNVPAFDVLATDEHCQTVPIQVKATNSDNWPSDARLWMHLDYDKETRKQGVLGKRDIANPELIYVCVSIAPVEKGKDRFFILTKSELQEICIESYKSYLDPKDWIRPKNPESYDNRYSIEQMVQRRYENRWVLIEQRFKNRNGTTLDLSTESE